MRHVPEEELHAYLDQALSRSQCVEIETHLARCSRCRRERDAIAALRDRTTALLGVLSPRLALAPPTLEALLAHPAARPRRGAGLGSLRRAGLWAAGLAAAVGAGWMARVMTDPHAEPARTAAVPLAQVAPVSPPPAPTFTDVPPDIPVPAPRARRLPARNSSFARRDEILPAPTAGLGAVVLPTARVVAAAASSQPAAATLPSGPLDRIWRSMSWEEAINFTGGTLPMIEGLPVIGVLLQAGNVGERPTVIVAQQDPSGEVLQSIEGPVGKVTELLRRPAVPDLNSSEPTRTAPDYLDGPGGARRSLRLLTVTGRLPADSLTTLARAISYR